MPAFQNSAFSIIGKFGLVLAAKSIFLLVIFFFCLITLILLRQVQLMGNALPTPVLPFLKFISIILIGASFAFFLVVLGIF